MEPTRKTIPTNNPAASVAPEATEPAVKEAGASNSTEIIKDSSELEKTQSTARKENAGSSTPALRTYKSDVAEAVKRKRESVASIVSAEQTRKRDGDGDTKDRGVGFLWFYIKKNALIMILGVFVLLTGVGLVSFFLIIRNPEPIITPSAQTLVFVNKEVKINIDGLDKKGLETKINEAWDTEGIILNDFLAITFFRLTQNSENKKLTEETAGLSEILSLVIENVPSELLRSLGENYLYGVHVLGENVPFLITEVRSYENAFSGLISWEKSMTKDIAPLFNITRFPPVRVYEYTDVLIKNRDVRVVFDEETVPILYYSFVDRKTLILTTDKTTFDEILNRLATPRRTLR